MSIVTKMTPFVLFMERYTSTFGPEKIKREGRGYRLWCPLHDGHSLIVQEGEDGKLLMNCKGGLGCNDRKEDILRAVGLSWADLYNLDPNHPKKKPKTAPPSTPAAPEGPKPTVQALAEKTDLPVFFLESLEVIDSKFGVLIRYRNTDGSPARERIRTALEGSDRFKWMAKDDGPIVPYGVWRRPSGDVFLVEGESDSWTLWFYDIPALGLPGADNVKCLQASHLAGAKRLFIVQEADQGGLTFVKRLGERLEEIGWNGPAYVVEPPDGCKDTNDVHRTAPGDGFRSWIRSTLEGQAVPLSARLAELDILAAHAVGGAWEVAPAREANGRPRPDPCVYRGPIGDYIRLIEPHTEADPVGLLLNGLIFFGSAAGTGRFYQTGGNRQYMRLFGVMVGDTARGRKGTATSDMKPLFQRAAPEWMPRLVTQGGLSSGEGLLHAVRDPRFETVEEKDKKTGEKVFRQKLVDLGEEDKRLCIVEPELAAALKQSQRNGNTLSAFVRKAYDVQEDEVWKSLTKNNKDVSTGAHISILAHVTRDELLHHMQQVDAFNGFFNRFLWVMVERSKVLPFGGDFLSISREIDEIGLLLGARIREAQEGGPVFFSDEAKEAWVAIYRGLAETRYGGLLDPLTARAESNLIRLMLIYSALDGSNRIKSEHVRASYAFYLYSVECMRHIFGDASGDPLADSILLELENAPGGLTQTQIYSDIFKRNHSSSDIKRALELLVRLGKVQSVTLKPKAGRGRPKTVYTVVGR